MLPASSTKERNRENNRRYRARHKADIAIRHKKWLAENPEKRQAHLTKFRIRNRDLLLEKGKLWRKNNPEKAKALVRKYQAHKMGVPAKAIDYEAIKKRCGMICGICWLVITGKYHFDHIIPLAAGGPHSEENLQLAHPICNQRKGFKVLEVGSTKQQPTAAEPTILY